MRPMSGARSRSRESSTFVPLRSSRGTRAPQAVLDCSPQRVAPRGRHAAAEPDGFGVADADESRGGERNRPQRVLQHLLRVAIAGGVSQNSFR